MINLPVPGQREAAGTRSDSGMLSDVSTSAKLNSTLFFSRSQSSVIQDISSLLASRSMSEGLKTLRGVRSTLVICMVIRLGAGIKISDYTPTWASHNAAACSSAAQFP